MAKMQRKGATKAAASANTKSASGKSSATASKSGANGKKGGQKSDQTMLQELFMDELKDIYWAEKHLTKALPKMAKGSTARELSTAFQEHLRVTEGQIKRLDKAFKMLGVHAKAKKCDAMEGLVSEAQSLMGELPKGTSVRDAGLIIAAQKVEHYEIAAYGSLVQLAKTMGKNDLADLLQQTLDEEKQADEMLTQIAESSINVQAESEMA